VYHIICTFYFNAAKFSLVCQTSFSHKRLVEIASRDVS